MAGTKRFQPAPPPKRGPIKEAAYVRGEFIVTILLDGLVILTAIGVRWIVLLAIRATIPAETETWAVHKLELISDIGMVAAAGIFTAFDLMKRVVIGARAFGFSFRSVSDDAA